MAKHGISLVGIAVALFILSLATFMFVRSQGNFLSVNKQITESLKGEEVLVGVSAQLQEKEFGDLVDLCKAKGAMAADGTGTDAAGTCLAGETLFDPSAQPAYTEGDPLLGLRLNHATRPDANGTVCVELQRCDFRAGQNALDATLKGFWLAAPGSPRVVSRVLVARRTRR